MNKFFRYMLQTCLYCFCSLVYGSTDLIQTLEDESSLFEEITFVYTASKYSQPVTEAPASVSIVTDDEIKKFGYRSLAEVLTSMKGMYTSYDRTYHRLGIRGFNRPGDYNYRILILVNGHRINDNIVDYNAIGTEFIVDIDDIKRVELVRGPASSLYGNNAFFGVINVITKQGRDLQSVSASAEGGSYHNYKGKFAYGDKFSNGAEVYFSGSYHNSAGKSHIDILQQGTVKELDGEHTERGFVNLSYQDFTLNGSFAHRSKDISVPIQTLLNDSRTVFVDQRAYVDLLYEKTFSNSLNMMARLYYDYYRFDGDYAFSEESLYQDDFTGQWWGSELKLIKQLGEHRISLGGEYRNNFQQNIRSFESPPLNEFVNSRQHSDTYGIYLQDEYRVLDNLTINIGFRYDNYSTTGDTVNPRAALIYQAFENTTFKFIYGQASRAPSDFEKNYAFSNTWITSNNLIPENLTTYELELSHKFNRHINATLTPFVFEVEDIIQLDGNGTAENPNIYRNTTNIDIYGFEFELNGQWQNGWKSRLSYAYQHANEKGLERTPVNSPSHLTKLNLIAPLWYEQVFAGLEIQYTSRRSTRTDSVPGFLLTNLTLYGKDVLPGLEVSGSLYNLLDRTYKDPVSPDLSSEIVEQNGIQFRLKLRYEF